MYRCARRCSKSLLYGAEGKIINYYQYYYHYNSLTLFLFDLLDAAEPVGFTAVDDGDLVVYEELDGLAAAGGTDTQKTFSR